MSWKPFEGGFGFRLFGWWIGWMVSVAWWQGENPWRNDMAIETRFTGLYPDGTRPGRRPHGFERRIEYRWKLRKNGEWMGEERVEDLHRPDRFIVVDRGEPAGDWIQRGPVHDGDWDYRSEP